MRSAKSYLLIRLDRVAKKSWYLPLIAALAALDAYVFFVPTEALLVPAILTRRKKWLQTTFWISLGSALGAASFAWLTTEYGTRMAQRLFPALLASREWEEARRVIQAHGGWGLALISFSIFPQHAAVAVAGLARLPVGTVLVAVLIGRFCKYAIVAWLAAKAPHVLARLGVSIHVPDAEGSPGPEEGLPGAPR